MARGVCVWDIAVLENRLLGDISDGDWRGVMLIGGKVQGGDDDGERDWRGRDIPGGAIEEVCSW